MRASILSFVLLAACSSPAPDPCGALRPSIESCASGATWAECGGEPGADPRFGCRRTDGRCFWFANGCVAEGFEASPCSADDLCCVDDAPFDASWRTRDPAGVAIHDFVRGWGDEPWDRAREANVDVVLTAPTVSGTALHCSGGELGLPCGARADELHVSRTLSNGALTVRVASARGDLGGWTLTLEVHESAGRLRARACRTIWADGVGDLSCTPVGPTCADAGVVMLAEMPSDEASLASLTLALDATFPDFTRMTLELGPELDPCGGAPPALDDCVRGHAWAECGAMLGDEPRLGCGGHQCYWFAGGCIAEGFLPTICPAADVCCVDDYPYADEPGSSFRGPAQLLEGWGDQPWDRARERNVGVTIAPLEASVAAIACSPEDARGPCRGHLGPARIWTEGALTLIASPSDLAFLYWMLSIEIVRNEDGSLEARVCRVSTTDAASARCVENAPPCATSGTLTIDAFPASEAEAATTRVDLSASFADGMTIDASL